MKLIKIFICGLIFSAAATQIFTIEEKKKWENRINSLQQLEERKLLKGWLEELKKLPELAEPKIKFNFELNKKDFAEKVAIPKSPEKSISEKIETFSDYLKKVIHAHLFNKIQKHKHWIRERAARIIPIFVKAPEKIDFDYKKFDFTYQIFVDRILKIVDTMTTNEILKNLKKTQETNAYFNAIATFLSQNIDHEKLLKTLEDKLKNLSKIKGSLIEKLEQINEEKMEKILEKIGKEKLEKLKTIDTEEELKKEFDQLAQKKKVFQRLGFEAWKKLVKSVGERIPPKKKPTAKKKSKSEPKKPKPEPTREPVEPEELINIPEGLISLAGALAYIRSE